MKTNYTYDIINDKEKTKKKNESFYSNLEKERAKEHTTLGMSKNYYSDRIFSHKTDTNNKSDSIYKSDGKKENTDNSISHYLNYYKPKNSISKNIAETKKRGDLETAVNNAYTPIKEKSLNRKINMNKEDIIKTQEFLNNFGYKDLYGKSLKVDGVMGEKTRGAFEKYIQSDTPKKSVLDLQKTLNKYDYHDNDGNSLVVDGKLGPKTDSAVMGAADDLSLKNITPKITNDKFKVLNNELTEQDYIDLYAYENSNSKNGRSASFNSKPDTYVGKSGVEKWYKLPDVSERIPTEYELYKKGEISEEIYKAMDVLSQRWYYADTENARDEIHNLAENVRKCGYKLEDCTEEANAQLRKNARKIKLLKGNLATAGLFWFGQVDKEKEWDYKVSGADWLTNKDCFLYHGQIISAADFGNINYGYTGTILGLSPETLYEAGGKLNENPTQFEKDSYYSDTVVDHYWIKKGIEQANELGHYGSMDLPVDFIFDILGR